MNNKLLLSLAGLLGAGPIFADWSIVNTFDDASALATVTDTASTVDSNARSEVVNGMWAVYPGDLFELNSNLYTMQDLGVDLKAESIATGKPVTVYLEIMQPTVDDGAGGVRKAIVDTVWGLSNVDADTVLDETYNSYNVMQRINSGNDNFEGRNGSGYVSVEPFQEDVKYSIWLVVDFNLNYYETYIQGGQWATQTKIDGGDGSGLWFFRVNPSAEQTIDQFLVALSRGNSVAGEKAKDPTFFDNIAIDTADANLTMPAIGRSAADWSVVNTYDDASALASVTDTASTVGSNARSEVVDGMWAVYPGDLFELNSNLYAMQDLGVDLKAESIASGGSVSVYLEIVQPTVDDGAGGTRKAIVDTVWGLSNVDPDTVLDETYNSYNVMQRINSGNDNFEGRNGSGYVSVEPFQENVKYHIWLIADFNLNYYETYIQGGQWATQTKIDGGDGSGLWFFRVNPSAEQTIDQFLVALSRGNSVAGEKAKDPTFFDNISIDIGGMNLSAPMIDDVVPPKGPGYMGNYDVVEGSDGQQWVDTGDWLGWVNIENYPVIFILDLNTWAYIGDASMDGDKDSTGAWVYVFK